MKSQTKMTITTFSGVAALAFAVGFGGLGASPVVPAPAPAAHASSSVAPAAPNALAPSAVHQAILTGCISGLDC
jgi:hypothetical protein